MQQQPKIELLLEEVVKRDASDLHLQVGLPPMIRIDGALGPVSGVQALNEETLENLVFSLLDEDQKQILMRDKEFDFSFAFGEVHYDTFSFSAALRSSLREDPDVVLIGEMRDLETIAAAITIAETGHLVFATLHTNSASQSIDRMVDVFPPHQQPQVRAQLGNMLQAICSQRLVPALSGGRIAAAEILVATPAVRNIIREGKNYQLEAVIQTGAEHGMQSMDRTLANLIHGGTISYEEARNYAVDLEELDRLMRG
jgi:Tfp pilus assembly pilus retraction ATPase PilT